MTELAQEIVQTLKDQPSLLAREIAVRLGVERNKVNMVLYGELRDAAIQDAEHRWQLTQTIDGDGHSSSINVDSLDGEKAETHENVEAESDSADREGIFSRETAAQNSKLPPELSTPARNLISAFEFLLELNQKRRKPTYRISDHGLGVFHEHELLKLPGVEFDLLDNDGEDEREVWLRVPRLHRIAPPDPDESLLDWVQLSNDPHKRPVLRTTIQTNIEDEEKELSLVDYPEIEEQFSDYLTTSWEAWSVEEIPRRNTIRVYDRIFSILQDAEAGLDSDDGIEICLGIGIAIWRHRESGTNIHYPILVKTVEVQLNHRSMCLDLIPTGRDPTIALEPYFSLDIDEAKHVEDATRRIFENAESTISPFDTGSFEHILRMSASRLDTGGSYWPDMTDDRNDRSLPKPSESLCITDTWVVFARQRNTDFIAEDVRRLRDQVVEGCELPTAAELIVTEPPDTVVSRKKQWYRGLSNPGTQPGASDQSKVKDLFFAKPFNEAQVSIIERLEQAPGVVVQGPPGTGKTHTIANIICHYLAEGKRVLVTAQHEAPLTVLRDQIPESLRPLAISLLTSEREGLKQLERSVRKISSEINRLQPQALRKEISNLESRISQLHELVAANDHELRKAGEPQLGEIEYQGESVHIIDMAISSLSDAKSFGWFVDKPDSPRPAVSESDISAMRTARAALGGDLQYISDNLIDPEVLPTPGQIVQLHRDLIRRQEIGEAINSGGLVPLSSAGVDAPESIKAFHGFSQIAMGSLKRLKSLWHKVLLENFSLSRSADTEKGIGDLLFDLSKEISSADRERTELLAFGIVIPEEAVESDGVFEAVERARLGKRPFPILSRDKNSKRLFSEISIQGEVSDDGDGWSNVARNFELFRRTRSLVNRWNQVGAEIQAPNVPTKWPDSLRTLNGYAREVAELHDLAVNLKPQLERSVEDLLESSAKFRNWMHDSSILERLVQALESHVDHKRLETSHGRLGSLAAEFEEQSGRLFVLARQFIQKQIGNAEVADNDIEKRWRIIEQEARRILGGDEHFTAIRRISRLIQEGGAPLLAGKLRTEPAESEDKLLPADFADAWEWGWGRGYLHKIDGQGVLKSLAEQRRGYEQELARSIETLVEHRTWLQLKDRLTQRVSAALSAYLTAITKIGKGTGVRAVSHRRDARTAMTTAQAAVPVWIMPHWRVSESLPPEFGSFDLVIIDEASQSDAWAIPAIVRSQKILIVGDDKQVSPSDVGVREDDNRLMRERFLKELPYGQHLLPGASMYDLGSTMFAADIIRLREHFRCVEPIIQFSNKAFYDNEILPLRIPTASERLDPPLVDVFVRGGFRDKGQRINRPEADAIVEEIRELSIDSRFDDRTIGVVSLLGAEQAKYIQDRLIDELGEETFLRHQIRCGDAMHFQGKEADIVMLSLVAAGDNIRPSTGRMFEQRFNVACSRARDRLYVFHSFTRDQVKDGDLKALVLDHLKNPLPGLNPKVQDLRSLCESEFEKEVFDELVSRSYRVIPQVRAGGFRIDLVVEGGNDRRLAIECDGDKYHGPDRWMDDLRRQRVLERMGWKFWRCWGSSWYRDSQSCLTDLLGTLESMNISPQAGGEVDQSMFVEFREVGPSEESVEDETAEDEGQPRQVSWVDEDDAPSRESETTFSDERKQMIAEVGDEITYSITNDQTRVMRVRIVTGQSEPTLGTINQRTPLAEALLGSSPGELVEIGLPTGTEEVRIVDILKS